MENFSIHNGLIKHQGGIILCPLSQSARNWGSRPSLQLNETTINYLQLNNAVGYLANWIKELDLSPNAIIAIQETNNGFGVIKILACLRAGIAIFPINPKHTSEQTEEFFDSIPFIQKLVWPEISSVVRETNKKIFEFSNNIWELDKLATLIFTSGSTAKPKAALHHLGNHYYSALGANAFIPLTNRDAWHLSLPFYHIAGLAIIIRCVLAGACIQLTLNENTTHVSWVNKQLFDYLSSLSVNPIKSVKKANQYKVILLGGGPIQESLVTKALRIGLPLYMSYGMTEMSSQIYTERLYLKKAFSKDFKVEGKVLTHRELFINSQKEILVKGKCLFQGYLQNGKIQKPFDTDGWFSTGDLGEWKNGQLRINGRRDNMFISRGENICPEQIEKVLLNIKGVKKAIVVPKSHKSHTNTICVFISWDNKKSGKEVSLKAIIQSYQKYLPKYLWPEEIHPWPSSVKSKNGDKINRQNFLRWLT